MDTTGPPPFRPFSSALLPPITGLLGILLGIGILPGCSNFFSNEPPLPDSTFADVLTELHLSKSRQTVQAPSPSGLQDSIFVRYDVTRTEVETTLRYYSRHPQAFESLYQSVIDTLQAIQYIRQERSLSEKVPDSISRGRRRTDPSQ